MVKLLIIGNSYRGVGKTNIISRFMDDFYDPGTIMTVGVSSKTKKVQLDSKDRNIQLEILDTAGKEKYTIQQYYKDVDGVIIVYDITDLESFENMTKIWLPQIEGSVKPDIDKIILGNKCDEEDKRVISTEKGQSLAEKCGCKFFETSAKNDTLSAVLGRNLGRVYVYTQWTP